MLWSCSNRREQSLKILLSGCFLDDFQVLVLLKFSCDEFSVFKNSPDDITQLRRIPNNLEWLNRYLKSKIIYDSCNSCNVSAVENINIQSYFSDWGFTCRCDAKIDKNKIRMIRIIRVIMMTLIFKMILMIKMMTLIIKMIRIIKHWRVQRQDRALRLDDQTSLRSTRFKETPLLQPPLQYDDCLSSFVSLDLVFFIVPTRMKIHYIVPFWNAKGNVYMKSFRKFENKFRTCIDVVVGVKLPGIIDWAK